MVNVKSPLEKAGVLSKLFFLWLYPILIEGRKRELTEENNLNPVHPEDLSKHLGDILETAWKDVHNSSTPHKKNENCPKGKLLLTALFKVYGKQHMVLGLVAFFEECVLKLGFKRGETLIPPLNCRNCMNFVKTRLKWYFQAASGVVGGALFYSNSSATKNFNIYRIAQPLCLGLLIRYFNGQYDELKGYLFATGIVFISAWYTVWHHPFCFAIQHNGMKIRVGVSSLIYRKALRLSQKSLGRATVGQMINFLSSDVNRLDLYKDFLHYIWIAPIQLIIAVIILWYYFGPSSLTGIGLLVLFIPFQTQMGLLFGKLRGETAKKADYRIRLVNEVFSAIRVIKMYTWESLFTNRVQDSRLEEMKVIKRTAWLKALNQSVYYVASKFIVFVTFLTIILTGRTLTAEIVFVTLALFNNVRTAMTLFLPYGISQLAETFVSIQRLETFLLLEEIEENGGETTKENPKRNGVVCENIYAKWNSENCVLANVSVKVTKGELLGLIGPAGCGKSSLLNAILRELPLTSGKIHVSGSIAYAAQDAWIFQGTVRENILFGKDYDLEWYQQVVEGCALKRDFTLFPYGDGTLVGDKGASLSGGQRARLNLARAVYSKADIYLLDDPLSAVDAKVARHLHDKCLRGLLKNKCVILVTHQVHFLRSASRIIVLNGGKIQQEGSFEEISSLALTTGIEEDEKLEQTPEDQLDKTLAASDVKFETQKEVQENTAKANSGSSLYYQYMRSGSGIVVLIFVVLVNIVTQALYSGSDYWLKLWTGWEKTHANSTSSSVEFLNKDINVDPRSFHIIVYSAMIGLLFFIGILRTASIFNLCLNSSISLHRRMFASISRAPMLFFETNSIGRILNRFSKDMTIIDDILPLTFFDTIEVSLQVVGILIVTIIVKPILLLPSAFITILFYVVRNFYLHTAHSVKHLEGSARSPVFSHLTTTLNGLTTIRAFKAEALLKNQFETRQDNHSKWWLLFLSSVRWLSITVDWISIFYTSVVIYTLMLTDSDQSDVGLLVSSAMALTGMLQYGVKQSAETANHITSVERVLEYSHLEPEADLTKNTPEKEWPSNGAIELKGMSLSYGGEKPVLKNISLNIRGQEKIGIVGRTGAGKSSLLTALFRLAEPSGEILIDGVNILNIGLHDLRSKLSIIPQDPILFSGTLRKNLDPLEERSDDEIWRVLAEVELTAVVQNFPEGLSVKIADGGLNFSTGQRQLVCLARAILRQNKILILDEATANVDNETDAKIQKTIRETFSCCTVIVIAHRLHTVMDCDRIIVMEAGEAKEFGEPYTLLLDSDSYLSKLVVQSGDQIAENLFQIAKKAYEEKRNGDE